ncbi:polymerase [Plectosphaerella plurivora]|uniref:Polymerase n=1 Tax=Plectosphaerella plurivora TaxID=936078 RepID=A0A9P8VND9_9PEZI|nr:polymerase [Plectosphaerella plurivora]
MTRRKFIADLASAANTPLPLVSGLKKGDDDGQVDFVYTHASLPSPVGVRLLNLDINEYPTHPGFLAFTANDHVPASVTRVLEQCPEFSENKKIADVCRLLSRKLTTSIESELDAPMTEDACDETGTSAFIDSDIEEEEEYLGSVDEDVDVEYDLEDFDFQPKKSRNRHTEEGSLPERLVSDLRMAQNVGFRVGIFSDPDRIFSLSMPAQALGLQEETLVAWGVAPKDYIVLLIKIEGAYTPAETFVDLTTLSTSSVIFRFGKCAKNKPSAASVALAFEDSKYKTRSAPEADEAEAGSPFEQLLVSNSMNCLLKFRLRYGLSWDEGILQLIKMTVEFNFSFDLEQDETTPIVAASALDPLNIDFVHHGAPGDLETDPSLKSLPLIAAHPRYCMYDFEAMKPYYIIEHEIITQPLVVDLLLREYPKGLGFNVPIMPPHAIMQSGLPPWTPSYQPPTSPVDIFQPVTASVNISAETLSFASDDCKDLKMGTLFALKPRPTASAENTHLNGVTLHCKATGITTTPALTFVTYNVFSTVACTVPDSNGAKAGLAYQQSASKTTSSSSEVPADLYLYDRNIDDLEPTDMRRALLAVLDTLPSVMDLHKELTEVGVGSLIDCKGISAPSLALLRWIVSSNRSLIMQVDFPEAGPGMEAIDALNKPDERLHGVGKGCVQFKFAQGSPDKEHRFMNAVKTEASSKTSKIPTMFAWHGSPVGNWHSIIRSGLDYSATVNGRAFGNGVYFSNHYMTSSSYSTPGISLWFWPGSVLKISSSISLCEIVNRPDQFVSRTPYFVVGDVDWIQCRYLLVNPPPFGSTPQNQRAEPAAKQAAGKFLKQDPESRPYGPNNHHVEIPSAALPRSRPTRGNGKSTAAAAEPNTCLGHTFRDDLDHLMAAEPDTRRSTHEIQEDVDEVVDCMFSLDRAKTDFCPGTLDIAALPKLPSPTWADDNGRKVLGRELRKMQKVQSSTPLHELGWFIDFEQTDNLFHWIVELHSFDPELPFAKDMKARKIHSIVLEIRFGRQYPISPPFVRVIRPRFLPFIEGGGGHITGGGAMCMELLTNTGWSPANSIEAVILQVRMAICNLEPTPARLQGNYRGTHDYGIDEAIDAYKRVAMRHGWQVPPDLDETARGI